MPRTISPCWWSSTSCPDSAGRNGGTMTTLTLAAASIIMDTALAEGHARGFHPLTVAVLDAGGHLVALKREDKSSLLRPQIATAKAWGVLGMGFGGRELDRRAQRAPGFFNVLSELADGRMVPVP